MHQAFLYISLPSLHDYDVKMPNFTLCGEREHMTTTLFSFAELWYSLVEFNSRKNCQHLTNWTRWNKRDKVWKSATVLFKWRFRSRIRKLPNINFVRRSILWSAFCLRTVVKDAYLPPHLYGQLVQKKSGFKLLQKTVSSMFLLSGCFGFAHFASQ